MLLSLFFNIIIMTLETQNPNLDVEKNKQEFDSAFKEELKPEDKNIFDEIVWNENYDKEKSKEENFQTAFNTKVDEMIEKNLKNLPPEKKEELKQLQKMSNKWKDMWTLVKSFQSIKESIATRNAESYKSTEDKVSIDKVNQSQQANKESQDFLDKLKTAIKENYEIWEKKRQEQLKKLAENNSAVWEEQNNAERILDWLESPTV